MRILCVALVVVLGGCGATPAPRDTAPARFDALMAYVPPGMESLMLAERTPPLPSLDSLTCGAMGTIRAAGPFEVVRLVQGGRRFAQLGQGFCDMEAVLVVQLAGRVPDGWDTVTGEVTGEESRIAHVAGRRVLYTPSPTRSADLGPASGSPYRWCLPVAEDLVLFTTRRALLEEALRKPGMGAAQATAALGSGSRVPWDAALILVRRFDHENYDDLGSPVAGPYLRYQREHSKRPVARSTLEGLVLGIPAGDGPMRVEVRIRTSPKDPPLAWLGADGIGPDSATYPAWDTRDATTHWDGAELVVGSTFSREASGGWRWAMSIRGMFGHATGY